MGTNAYVSISSDIFTEDVISNDIKNALAYLTSFESKYSRFNSKSELSKLNASSYTSVSTELYDILTQCEKYYKETNGVFDPAILPVLINEGYIVSKGEGFITPEASTTVLELTNRHTFEKVELIPESQFIKKPLDLKIDLGGIGKGYAVDVIAKGLKSKYTSFCLDIGGDMFLAGTDESKGYPYWAIEIENPYEEFFETPTLIVKDMAIATSGVNKRKWIKQGFTKHHIIDPKSNLSVRTNIVTASVIANSTVEADILAKTLVILGLEQARDYCELNGIAAIICTNSKKLYISKDGYKYVWQE